MVNDIAAVWLVNTHPKSYRCTDEFKAAKTPFSVCPFLLRWSTFGVVVVYIDVLAPYLLMVH